MIGKGFSHHVSRSQMDGFIFSSCVKCHETVIRATVRTTQREQIFNPKSTGGSEVDPVYSLHVCKK